MLNAKTWINAVIKPKETFASEKANASIGAGLINYIIAGVIVGIIGGALAAVTVGPFAEALGIPLDPGMLIVSGIVNGIISGILISLIVIGILHIFAKLLGGTGSYTQTYYLTSLYAVVIGIVGTVLGAVPFIGPFLTLLVILYALYLLTLALKETHGYSTGRAVLTWLIPVIIVVILVFIISIIAISALLALTASQGPSLDIAPYLP